MSQISLRLNRRPTSPPSGAFEWTLAADSASVDKGDPVAWSLNLNLNAAAFAECFVSFSGQTVGYPTGTFQVPGDTITAMVGNAATTANLLTPGACTWDGNRRITLHQNVELNFLRGTVEQSIGSVTITNASPGVLTLRDQNGVAISHNFTVNAVIRLTTSGALPTGLAINTDYYVRNPSGSTFELSATSGGASINTSSAGSGTHLLHYRPGLSIVGVSLGTILTSGDISCTLVDPGTTLPGAGVLHHLTFSANIIEGPALLTGVAVAAGTELFEILGADEDDLAVVPDSVALVDTLDGRFAVRQTGAGGSARFFCDAGAGPSTLNFESAVTPVPAIDYRPTFSAIKGAATVQGQNICYPRYAAVLPTGNTTGPTTSYSTAASWAAACNSATANRTIEILPGIYANPNPQSNGAYIFIKANNLTLVGHPQAFVRTGKVGTLVRNGSNIIIRNYVFAAIIELPVPNKDVDGMQLGFQAAAWERGILFDHCTFLLSNDELASITGLNSTTFAARGVRWTYCLFSDALFAANHSSGSNFHNHGPSIGFNVANCVVDHSLFAGCDTREPLVKNAYGVMAFNNVHIAWRPDTGAARWVATQLATAQPLTGRQEASLFVPGPSSVSPPITGRARAITFFSIQESNSHIYVPDSGNYLNYFCNPGTDSYPDDPLVVNDGIYFDTCSSSAVRRTLPTFDHNYTIDPTNTEALRRALANDVLTNAGNGGVYSEDVLALARVNTVRTFTTLSQFQGLYGVALDGVGGSLGHGVV